MFVKHSHQKKSVAEALLGSGEDDVHEGGDHGSYHGPDGNQQDHDEHHRPDAHHDPSYGSDEVRPNLSKYFWRGEEKFNKPQRLEIDDVTPAGDERDEEQRVQALQMTIDETMRS